MSRVLARGPQHELGHFLFPRLLRASPFSNPHGPVAPSGPAPHPNPLPLRRQPTVAATAQPRQPPELTADVIGDIILRLPPDDPACLVLASLVCKLWRGIISDHTFPVRYRKFHRTAPVLGFFDGHIPLLVPVTAASPFTHPKSDTRGSRILDCRHGRVILRDTSRRKLAVWDPTTGHRLDLHEISITHNSFYSATVLCGRERCDHLGCHGVPFLVVSVWLDRNLGLTHACVYSSHTGAWGAPASVLSGYYYFGYLTKSSLLIGDEIYFFQGDKIIMYDMGKHYISMINPPANNESDAVLVPMEDGSMGLAYSRKSSIYLWSRKVNSEGVARWMQCRVIELEKLIPAIKSSTSQSRVIGFAEGVGAIFVSSEGAGTFTIELKSGRVRKIDQWTYYAVFPFLSFYTPDCASRKVPSPSEIN